MRAAVISSEKQTSNVAVIFLILHFCFKKDRENRTGKYELLISFSDLEAQFADRAAFLATTYTYRTIKNVPAATVTRLHDVFVSVNVKKKRAQIFNDSGLVHPQKYSQI